MLCGLCPMETVTTSFGKRAKCAELVAKTALQHNQATARVCAYLRFSDRMQPCATVLHRDLRHGRRIV